MVLLMVPNQFMKQLFLLDLTCMLHRLMHLRMLMHHLLHIDLQLMEALLMEVLSHLNTVAVSKLSLLYIKPMHLRSIRSILLI